MYELEPFYQWRDIYRAEDDPRSPFYNREYSEIFFSNAIYDHYIHPQWDEFGSQTLFLKLLNVNYDKNYCIIELIGEWNDLLYNDIMYLYRDVIEYLIDYGIKYYILIGENVLNLHSDTDDYYEEWFSNIDDGWIIGLNFRDYVISECEKANIDYYISFRGEFNDVSWRKLLPDQLFIKCNSIINKRLGL